MPRKATARPARVVSEPVVEQEYSPEETPAPAPAKAEPKVVQPATKNAKVKGTWTMFYANNKYDFVDGNRYDLPLDLFEYLKNAGNIYDTL
jgi:hypothetical protein